MDEAKFNMSMRKFLKQVGVTAQQRIEQAVRDSGKSAGKIRIKAVVSASDISLSHTVEGEIDLG
jgi:hypothetical protein